MPRLSPSQALPALLALSLFTGCGGANPLESATATRLKGVSNMYLSYAVSKGGGPATEATFKKYLHSVDAIQLQNSQIDPKAIDAIFLSERDQQPFVILYGKSISRISGESKEVLAYEKTGLHGKHLLAYLNGKVDYVSDAKLQELLAVKEESPTAKTGG